MHTFEQSRLFSYAVGNLVGVEGVNVDAKMNGHGQQVVSVYSARPPNLFVATPLRWDELDDRLDPSAFTLETVLARMELLGDLAGPLVRGRQRLPT